MATKLKPLTGYKGIDPTSAPAPAPSTPPPATAPIGGLTPDQENAYQLVLSLFKQYDLETLAPQILKMVQNGFDTATISVMLQDTPEYKQRFAANEARKKAGMPVLSPAEYINLERSYRQVLSSFGLPKGFYDSPADFQDWIANDVSASEINDRAQIASDAVNSSDPAYVQALQQMGLGHGDMIASVLDQKRALPVLRKIVSASQIGAEGIRQGLNVSTDRAMQWASQGVTQQQAAQAYQAIGENVKTAQALGQRYGESYGQTDLEDELLGGSGLASAKRRKLAALEQGSFAGTAGTDKSSLSKQTKGSF
jgi:hypothetical protein